MKVCVITATCGRHSCIERSVRFFLEQTYKNSVQLIYNNSCTEQQLAPGIDRVILVNNCKDELTGLKYTNLGAIYRDCMRYVPQDVEVISFYDDDDTFLPNHIEEGVKGLLKGGKTAYKPKFSYYRTKNVTIKINNVLEPSIFVKKEHVFTHGFSDTSTPQHHQWLQPLIDTKDIFQDEDGQSTLIYDWNVPIFKTSGNPTNPENFDNYHKNSIDEGDGIITPVPRKEVEKYYKIK